MIGSFRSNALNRYWTKGQEGRIRPEWRSKVRLILISMAAAKRLEDMDVPSLGLHRLTGDQRGRYAVLVSRNWRITFGWNGNEAVDIDLGGLPWQLSRIPRLNSRILANS